MTRLERLPGTLRILLLVFFLLGMLLLVLPYGISRAISHALTTVGMQSVSIEDVDFNPFSGTFGVKGLRMLNLQQQEIRVPKLEVRFAWLPLLQKHLLVERVLVQRAHLSIQLDEQGKYHLAGIPLPLMMDMAQGEPSAWSFEIRRVLFGGTLSLYFPWYKGTVNLDSLQVSDISNMRTQKPFRVSAIVHASGATLMLDGSLNPFDENAFARGTLKIKRLSLTDVQHMAAPWMPADMMIRKGRLDAEFPFTLPLQEEKAGSLVVHQGTLALQGLELDIRQHDVTYFAAAIMKADTLSYDGAWHVSQGYFDRLHMRLGTAAQAYDLKVKKLTFSAFDLGKSMQLKTARVVEGQAEILSGQQKSRFEVQHVLLEDLRSGDQQQLRRLSADHLKLHLSNKQTLQAKHLLLGKVFHHADTWKIAEAKLDALAWQDESPRRKLGHFTFRKLQALNLLYHHGGAFSVEQLRMDVPAGGMATAQPWAESVVLEKLNNGRNHLRVGIIRINKSRIQLLRDKQKHWWFGELPLAGLFRGEESENPWLQRVDQVQMSGGFIAFHDTYVSPAYNGRFRLVRVRIQGLNLTRPSRFSPFSVQLAGQGGASITAHGKVRPFTRTLALTSKVSIRSFSLPSVSPFLVASMGYGARTGQLDADIILDINQGRLQGESKLLLRQLEVTHLKGKGQRVGALSMPLDTALDMLRDSHNDIELSIPVSGDIRNPQFNYQDAINKALGTALQKAALGYIAQALQPYGALVTVADLAYTAGKKMMVVKLEPLLFAAGSTQMDEEKLLPYMQHLAGLMQKKNSLRLTLCGKATESDRQALQREGKKAGHDALLALAGARSVYVRNILMEQFGLQAERLFLCQSEKDDAGDAKPRVEMTLH